MLMEQHAETKLSAAQERDQQHKHQAREVRRVTLWGLLINLVLSAMKFTFGVIGSSQALIADSVHSLSDSATDVAVLAGAPFWSAPADADHPHGHGRIETLITLVIGAVLAIVGVGLGYKALATILAPHQAQPGWIVFFTACLSIVSKEALYRWTASVGRRVHSSALAANAWHHRSDALSSVPVAVAVLGTRIHPDWTFLDHVGALLVSLLILQAAWHICWPALNQLTDAAASKEELRRLSEIVKATPGVMAVHALRTRNIGDGLQVDLHVLVDPGLTVRDGHNISGAVKKRLIEGKGATVVDVLIHVEPYEGENVTKASLD
jgi:cation diffusion facilitator family transporter